MKPVFKPFAYSGYFRDRYARQNFQRSIRRFQGDKDCKKIQGLLTAISEGGAAEPFMSFIGSLNKTKMNRLRTIVWSEQEDAEYDLTDVKAEWKRIFKQPTPSIMDD